MQFQQLAGNDLFLVKISLTDATFVAVKRYDFTVDSNGDAIGGIVA